MFSPFLFISIIYKSLKPNKTIFFITNFPVFLHLISSFLHSLTRSLDPLVTINLFNNYTSVFNKINILKQGVLTPCINKKFRLLNISIYNFSEYNNSIPSFLHFSTTISVSFSSKENAIPQSPPPAPLLFAQISKSCVALVSSFNFLL